MCLLQQKPAFTTILIQIFITMQFNSSHSTMVSQSSYSVCPIRKKDVCIFFVFACFTSHSNLPNANSCQQQTVDHWGNQQMTLVSHEKQEETKWMNMPDYVWPHVIAKAYH
jgi:hypothetical protein